MKRFWLFVCVLTALPIAVRAAEQEYERDTVNWDYLHASWLPELSTATPDEAILATFSAVKAAEFLDRVNVQWAAKNHCGTCHTSIAYVMARPQLPGADRSSAWLEVRNAISRHASEEVSARSPFATFLAAPTVAALAVGDAAASRPFQADTRALVDYLWTMQGKEGNWPLPEDATFTPFLERDVRYQAMQVALALGFSPSDYRGLPGVVRGMDKLRGYLHRYPPENVHDRAVLLWASVRTGGLLTQEQQLDIERALLGLQRSDGGWSLPSMGSWPRIDGAPNDPNALSDGYATGLAALVLCERGYRDSDAAQRAVGWIETHQRESGRWYTRSLYSDRFRNYLSNMGTAYIAMALHACRGKAR